MSTRSQLSKKPSQLQWNGIWCRVGSLGFRNKYLFKHFRLIGSLLCRGGPKACPITISDLVLLHNRAAEGLAKTDRLGYDIYSAIADMKALFLKHCRPFEKRIRSMVPKL